MSQSMDYEEISVLTDTLKVLTRHLTLNKNKLARFGNSAHAPNQLLMEIEDQKQEIRDIQRKLLVTMDCPVCRRTGNVQVRRVFKEKQWIIPGVSKKVIYHITYDCQSCGNEFTLEINRANPWKFSRLLIPAQAAGATGLVIVGMTNINRHFQQVYASQALSLASYYTGQDLLGTSDNYSGGGSDDWGEVIEAGIDGGDIDIDFDGMW